MRIQPQNPLPMQTLLGPLRVLNFPGNHVNDSQISPPPWCRWPRRWAYQSGAITTSSAALEGLRYPKWWPCIRDI